MRIRACSRSPAALIMPSTSTTIGSTRVALAALVKPSRKASVAICRTCSATLGETSGGTGVLLTGHAVLRVGGGQAIGTERTTVRFGQPTERELDAYLAAGEPLAVAGGFTIDGLGGWFVEGLDGDPSSVIGISLPLTRRLLREVGVSVVDLWSATRTG